MMMLQSLFISVINLSIAASFLMLALVLLRPFLKRLPKWFVCAMWAMVAVRLAIPFQVESSLSLVPAWRISLSSEKEQIPIWKDAGNLDPDDGEVEIAAGDSAAAQTGRRYDAGEGLAEKANFIGPAGNVGKNGDSEPDKDIKANEVTDLNDSMAASNAADPNAVKNANGMDLSFDGAGALDTVESMAQHGENTLSQEEGAEESSGSLAVSEEMLRKNFRDIMFLAGTELWFIGVLVTLAYGLLSSLRLRQMVRTASHSDTYFHVDDRSENTLRKEYFSGHLSMKNRFLSPGRNVEIWSGSGIVKPFVMGFLHPRIYLPETLKEQDLDCVLRHEFAHVKRGDYLWKPLGFLILCVYWFHPLCWVSYFLFCRDVEMACDEMATKEFDPEQRARYCQTILDLSSDKGDSLIGTVAFGQNGTKSRVEAVLKYKKTSFWMIVIGVLVCLFLGFFFLTSPNGKAIGDPLPFSTKDQETGTEDSLNPSEGSEASSEQNHVNQQDPGNDSSEASQEIDIRLSGKEAWLSEGIDISDFYARDDGDIQNAYVIDEDGVLWGYGENRYGQLGQGIADQKFYKEKVKVAENAIHVDDSETGFAIYLTEDHRLYGLGNDGSGVLLTGGNVNWNSHAKDEEHAVCTPIFLMDHVQYACCGRNDVVCLLEDGSVWTWGITGISTARAYNYVPEPVKILDGAILVTGGLFNHAALLEDGSVWTWGYNYAGGCGVEEFGIVDTPTKVAEDVIKVWTSQKRTNTCADYENMSPINEKQMETTIIEKADHSFLRCGEGVGGEEIILKKYYEAVDFPMICTHQFLPCTPRNFDGTEATAEDAFKRFLSGDRTVLDPEQKRLGGFAGYLFGLDHNYMFEYVLMDLDGDGTEELIVQGGDNPGDYNGVFHYESETGRVISWRDDAFESDRVYPLTDGSLAKQWRDYTLAREFWIIFRYLSDGEEEEIKRLVCGNPSADIVEAGLEERIYPWYEIDGVEVTKEEFQKEYEKSIYNKRVTSWRNVATGKLGEPDEIMETTQEEVVSVLQADVTQDGKDDMIVTSVTYRNDERDMDWRERITEGANCYVRVYRGSDETAWYDTGKAIYTLDLAAGYGGNNLLYVARRDGKEYLLMENHALYQMECYNTYQVFSLDEKGNQLMIEEEQSPAYRVADNVSDWSALPVEDMVIYSKKMDSWIKDGTMILMTYHSYSASGGVQVLRPQGESFGAWEIWRETDEMVEYLIAPYLQKKNLAVSYQGPEKKNLGDMKHLKESLENLNQRWLALCEFEQAYEKAYRVDHEEQEGKQITYSDLTGDLSRETITVEYAAFQADNQQPVVISVQNGQGRVIWSDRIWGPHMGWGMYYHVIYGEDDRHYLLHLLPIENSQGSYYGEFQIFSFDEEGKTIILDERHVSSDEEELNYTKAKAEYLEALNAYLKRSFLLAGIWDFELSLYDPKKLGQNDWKYADAEVAPEASEIPIYVCADADLPVIILVGKSGAGKITLMTDIKKHYEELTKDANWAEYATERLYFSNHAKGLEIGRAVKNPDRKAEPTEWEVKPSYRAYYTILGEDDRDVLGELTVHYWRDDRDQIQVANASFEENRDGLMAGDQGEKCGKVLREIPVKLGDGVTGKILIYGIANLYGGDTYGITRVELCSTKGETISKLIMKDANLSFGLGDSIYLTSSEYDGGIILQDVTFDGYQDLGLRTKLQDGTPCVVYWEFNTWLQTFDPLGCYREKL